MASLAPLVSFIVYMIGVGLLAWWSARIRTSESFVSEYFLGGRSLGVWALALTFAATAASGGTFVGFPALVYLHGWVLALWIAGYMMVPIVGMGLLGKRLNEVSQRSGALTLPEVMTKRLDSPAVGGVATVLIVFFMFCYLVAQFKAGSKILSTLLWDVPMFQQVVAWVHAVKGPIPWIAGAEADYLLCLTVFAVVVIAYVVYGGFRAVVWTDVMQGIIMVLGVALMLVLVLQQTGGLTAANERLATMTPPNHGTATLEREGTERVTLAKGAWIETSTEGVLCLAEPCVFVVGEQKSAVVEVLEITTPWEIERQRLEAIALYMATMVEVRPYAHGANQAGVFLTAPGPDETSDVGYLTLTLAFSFFVFWAFGTAGQPGNMVRLMAFKHAKTLRYAIVTVSIYFSIIYFTLVVIFCCGRTLLSGMEIDLDRTMPELATVLTAGAGVPWLAGLLLAAPFAAVMSSVDSFLLVASSSLVRDVYQRFIRPDASEVKVKRLSYLTTASIGAAAFLASLRPPDKLQDVIVFASGGVGAAFLVPMVVTLYWRRANGAGIIAGMIGGTVTHLILHATGAKPLGLNPFVWDQLGAALSLFIVTYLTLPPKEALVARFFSKQSVE
ncbi:MAG: sodium/pantothenate symporter [Verrucomicrobiales bacterium]|jgi:sodium/pantothenate symporter